jgi:RimJ/RimL family protein N-acetyltransferase
MTEYFLQTQRLCFRTWTHADFAIAEGLWGDPEVTRLLGGPFSPDAIHARLAREIASHFHYGVQYWPVFLLATGENVGCCGLRPYRREDGVFELGVHLRRAYWGRGFAFEASAAVMTHAFVALGIKALFAGHNPTNEGSRRLLTRLGFRYTHDEFYAPTGLEHPSYLVEAADFEQGSTLDPRDGG